MSISSLDTSVTSTKTNGDVQIPSRRPSSRRKAVAGIADPTSTQSILLFLIAFRILNALSIKTFFQPDEYFQSLEPAWRMVFGEDSGAWITWEWKNELRSAIHPSIFAAAYYLAHLACELSQLSPATRASLLLATSKTLQAVCAALGDYYTWRLAQRLFGRESRQAWAALALTVASPWQWFCSTRTFSNCMETTLTIAALCNWPWQWSLVDHTDAEYDDAGLRTQEHMDSGTADETTRLRRALLLAATATILRPTNLLIWMVLVALTCLKMSRGGWLVRLPGFEQQVLVDFTFPALIRATRREQIKLITESCLCGSAILFLSLLVDRLYYGLWTFPPIKFLRFNVVQSLSVFYGTNDWHYYLSQGYPLLLTTALPFAIVGIYQSIRSTDAAKPDLRHLILSQCATIVCLVPAILSIVSHKEVRFVYPLLPLLHVLAATPLALFFGPSLRHRLRSRLTPPYALPNRMLLACLLAINFTIAIYTTTVHNRGVVDVLTYLRDQYEFRQQQQQPPSHHHQSTTNVTLTAAFLMPCHSTPWRSHLIHPEIHAWALTCEPPLHLSSTPEALDSYMDEADIFYADPLLWLETNMNGRPPTQPSRSRNDVTVTVDTHRDHERPGKDWPEYIIFFSQLEKTMHAVLKDQAESAYMECWRGFNSHWHDDRRRKGDVVVWCLDHKEEKVATKGQNSLTQRIVQFASRNFRSTMKEKDDRPQQQESTNSGDVNTGDSLLAGARGPWGIGKSTSRRIPPSTPAISSYPLTWSKNAPSLLFDRIKSIWSWQTTEARRKLSSPPSFKKNKKAKAKAKAATIRKDAWS